MIAPDRLAVFALTAFVLIVIPGPSVLFVVSRALSYGRRAALRTVVGNALGEGVIVVAVAVGVGALVEESVLVFTIMKLVGAAYLILLGIKAIRDRRSLVTFLEPAVAPRTDRRTLLDGVVVGLTNPKSLIFFAAILPQFANRSAGHVPLQLIVLGVIFILIALVSDTAWGIAAGGLRTWFARSPRRLERIGGAGGLVMIGLGTRLALTGRHD
jgi:threonine/homoserine/homoserine lactone efflux protein